jgi:light-regulated signal transduction histidine kinase (bacteriophytochrome)/CheY-like chemotaxis protein
MPTTPPSITTCDAEPIHLLAAIQPIGFLLSVNADWIVVRASANVAEHLQASLAEVIGHPAAAIIPPDLVHDIRGHMQQAGQAGVVEPLFHRSLRDGGPPFAVAIHRSGHETVLEFEQTRGESTMAPTALRGIMARVERHPSLPAVFREAARQMRALTRYDRVMIYRFDDSGCGEVVGEAVRHGITSFMGLRYPASDIPSQARALYITNLTRIIVDVDAAPVEILPLLSPEGERLDLSHSVLRSVSPIHLEYLRNMGVRSSMSISVLQGGRLWGLIACHHSQPNHVDLETRLTAELFGQMFSYLLEVRQREEDALYDARAKEIHDRIAPAFATPGASINNIPDFLSDLMEYVHADGVGAFSAGQVSLMGRTPTAEEFLQLVRFLNRTASGRIFETHDLGAAYPPARDYVMRAAGLLSIPVSRTPRDYLVFFRREIVQTVTWAGEPAKVESLGPNGVRLTPRKSFAAWREIVQGQSLPWTRRELHAAKALRLTLIELVLRIADMAQADRQVAQQKQEFLIAELNHRVRNLLGMVRGLIIQSASTASDVRTLVQSLDSRIQAMARAHDLLTESETASGSMHALLHAEVSVFADASKRMMLAGPDVMLQPKAFSAMALIIHELVANARKYGSLKNDTGTIDVATATDVLGNVTVAWRESGGPPVSPPQRRGFGTTILEQAIAFEVNGTSSLIYSPFGLCLDLMLPAEAASLAPQAPPKAAPQAAAQAAPQAAAQAAPSPAPPAMDKDLVQLLKTSLLVEDNLFIAMDAEDMLRKLGARTVLGARSVAEALGVLEDHPVSFAMLDVNLGHETSLPIARVLRSRNIPFAFGTGYGDTIVLPEFLGDVPIVSKPYHAGAFEQAMRHLLSLQTAAAALPV